MPANKEHTEATPSSLAVAAGEYLDYLAVERGLARNTIAAYRRDLTTYCAYLERAGIVSFEEVTRQVVEGFVADRRDGGYSDASVERALAAVKGLHAFLVRDGAVPKIQRRRCAFLKRLIVCRSIYRWRMSRRCSIKTSPRARWACATMPSWKCSTDAVCV